MTKLNISIDNTRSLERATSQQKKHCCFSSKISDQIMAYTPGTLVWCKVANDGMWCPGEIVDRTTPPKEFFEELNATKRVRAIVYFEVDEIYEPVYNLKNLLPYSCYKKMEFIEKGHKLYVKQKRSPVGPWVNFEKFILSIKNIEKKIQGDVHIFDRFEQRDLKRKQRKTKAKGSSTTKNDNNIIGSRRSLPSLENSQSVEQNEKCKSENVFKKEDTEEDHLVCLLDSLSLPDWAKNWEDPSHPDHELYAGMRKYATIDRKKQMECFDTDLLAPEPFTAPFEPTVTHELHEYRRLKENTVRLKVAYDDDEDDDPQSQKGIETDPALEASIQEAKVRGNIKLNIKNPRIVGIDFGDD